MQLFPESPGSVPMSQMTIHYENGFRVEAGMGDYGQHKSRTWQ